MQGQAALNAPGTDIRGVSGEIQKCFFVFFPPNKINVTEIKAHCAAAPGSRGRGMGLHVNSRRC